MAFFQNQPSKFILTCCAFILLHNYSVNSSALRADYGDGNSLLLRKVDQTRKITQVNTDNRSHNDVIHDDNTRGESKKPILVCGNKEPNNEGRRRKRYAVFKIKGEPLRWETHHLTWAIVEPSRQAVLQPLSKQRRIVEESLALWSAVSPMQFVMVDADSQPDIRIRFAVGKHGPEFDAPFDGKQRPFVQNTLAHAWGPGGDPKGYAGDVHVDDEDDWSEEQKLKWTFVHELGHSLGLQHSKDVRAIMYFGLIGGTPENVVLGADDIRGIEFLYGPRVPRKVTPKPQATPQPRTHRPRVTRGPGDEDRPEVTPDTKSLSTFAPDSICMSKTINAVIEDPFRDNWQRQRFYYVIAQDVVYQINGDGRLLWFSSVAEMFPGMPENPDVAFTVTESKSIFFIKDNKIWELTGSGLTEDSPKPLDHTRLPEKPRYAISVVDRHGETRRFIFGNRLFAEWARFSRPQEITRRFSRNLPQDVMFATTWTDNLLYVVSKNSYIVMDPQTRRKTHEKAYEGKPVWMRPLCSSVSV